MTDQKYNEKPFCNKNHTLVLVYHKSYPNHLMIMKFILTLSVFLLLFPDLSFALKNEQHPIKRDHNAKTITITVPTRQLSITIDYANGCVIKQLRLKGKNVLSGSGVYTGISTQSGKFSSAAHSGDIRIHENADGVILSGINYGNHAIEVSEVWAFKVNGYKILWDKTSIGRPEVVLP